MVKNIVNSKLPDVILSVCSVLAEAGGQAWLVGGCVRDLLLGIVPKDWDIEVFGLEEKKLESVLKALGHCEHVGKQFGVRKLWLDKLEIDIALPRKEIKTGQGHQGFDVQCDPHLAPEQATLRRDFTINAMMYDPLKKTLLDFHHGQQDLQHRKLKHVSSAFVEDPLRPLRAMQFAARFALALDKDTALLCEKLLVEAKTLPASRIWDEWLKWAKAEQPSFGLKALQDMGWDSLYPQLKALQSCPQDAFWHPEGDVWIHTCLVVDEARKLCSLRSLSEKDSITLVFAALCHDLGKPDVTFTNEEGKICSPNHGKAGVKSSLDFLHAISAPKGLVKKVKPLVCEHVAHFSGEPTTRAVKRLAKRLLPSNIKLWEILTEADSNGRHPAPPSRPALVWLNLAEGLGITLCEEPAIITGKLLLEWGMKASPAMGEMLRLAYEAQVEGEFANKTSAYKWFCEVNHCKF
ncbi:MAG TPA: CCA tRNA nucleotidyltransferase [Mariprofundaceae bacterium]|nr:CCA tRNA nucleotidyltransferase [Mariprofundaceae bacterium]